MTLNVTNACVCVSQGGLSKVLAFGEVSDTHHHPNHTTPPLCLPLLCRLSWLHQGTPHTGESDFRASVTFWVCHELQPRGSDRGMKLTGSMWNMAAVLFAVIYGGSQSCHATLLWLLFTPQHRNDCACLMHGGGNYSIIVHREFFCWVYWVEIKSSQQPTCRPVLLRKMRPWVGCTTDSCVGGICEMVADVMAWMCSCVLIFEKYN